MAVPNLTANSPAAGSIAWGAFSIQYGGVTYSVTAGSTSQRYVWWLYNNGSPILSAGAAVPTNLTDDDLVLFVNKSGIPVNVQASSVVEGSLIVDGTIVGTAIAAGTIQGDRIKAGTITGDLIAADTITADLIGIGDFTNYASGSDFEGVHPWKFVTSAVTTTVIDSAQAYQGTKSLKSTFTASSPINAFAVLETPIKAAPGDKLYVEFYARRDAAFNGTTNNSKARIYNQNGNGLIDAVSFGVAELPIADTWVKLSKVVTIPAGVTDVVVSLMGDATAGSVWIDNVVIRRMLTGELVVDGAISADKLAANAVTARTLNVIMGGGNIVPNSSFENPASLPLQNSSNATVTQNTNLGSHGSACLQITAVAAGNVAVENGTYAQKVQLFPVTPDRPYAVSFDVRSNGASRVVRCDYAFVDAAGTGLGYTAGTVTVTDNPTRWQRLRQPTTLAPATATHLRVVQNIVGAAAGESHFLDALQVEEGDVATSYTPKTDEILPGTITADMIHVNGLAADSIKTGTMSADRIDANTLTISKVKDLSTTLAATASATSVTALTAQVNAGEDFSANPYLDSPAGSVPTGFSGVGSSHTKTTTAGEFRTGTSAVKFTLAAGATNCYLSPSAATFSMAAGDYVTVVADIKITAGTSLNGSGLLVRWTDSGARDYVLRFDLEIPTPVVGQWYRIQKVVKRPASYVGPLTSFQVFLMGAYGPMGTTTAKTLIFDRVDAWPSTTEEIAAYNGPADAQARADAAVLVALDAQASNTNSVFSRWTTSTLPEGWTAWNAGATKNIVDQRTGTAAVEFTTDAVTLAGLFTSMSSVPLGVEYLTIETDVMLKSGTFSGSGVLMDWNGMTPTASTRSAIAFKDIVSSPVLNKWYRITKVIRRPTVLVGTQSSWGCLLMGNYAPGVSDLGPATAKGLIVDRFAVRPSSVEEITAYNTPGDISTAKADALATAATDATGKANAARTNAVADLKTLWGHPANTTLIDGGDIYTNTITARSIALGDFTNLHGDRYFNILPTTTLPFGAGHPVVTTATPPAGGNAVRLTSRDHVADPNLSPIFDCRPGDEFFGTLTFKYETSTLATDPVTMGLYQRKADNSTTAAVWYGGQNRIVFGPDIDLGNGWFRRSWNIKAGSAATYPDLAKASLWINVDQTAGSGVASVLVTDVVLMKRNGGELLVDGAIKTTQLDTDAVTAVKIKAGEINAGHLSVGSVTTEKLSVGSIGDNLILNGTFKDLATTGVPTGWSVDAAAGTGGNTVDGVNTYLRVTTPASPTGNVFQNTTNGLIPVNPTDQFHVEVGATSTGGTGKYRIAMFAYDRTGAWLNTVESADLNTGITATAKPSATRGSAVMTVTNALATHVRFGLRPITGSQQFLFDRYTVGKVNIGARIADDGITAEKIKAKAIIAGKIDTNAVRATNIEAGAITADKIHLSAKGFAVNDNSSFELEALDSAGVGTGSPFGWWAAFTTGAASLGLEKTSPLTGSQSAKVTVATNANMRFGTDPAATFPVLAGDKWFVSARVKAVGGNAVVGSPTTITFHTATNDTSVNLFAVSDARVVWMDASAPDGSKEIANGQEVTLTGTFTVPAGMTRGSVSLQTGNRTAAGTYIVEDFVAHPAVENTMVTDISAGKITTGFIQAGQRIVAGANLTGARVEMNPTGVFGYNSLGVQTFGVSSDGSAYFRGSIFGSYIEGSELVAGDPNAGAHVRVKSDVNYWTGGTQGMIRFATPFANGWNDGTITSEYFTDSGSNWAALRLTPPHERSAGWPGTSFLDLRNDNLGKSKFYLRAQEANFSGNTFTWGAATDSTNVDFRQFGTGGFQFSDYSQVSRLRLLPQVGFFTLRSANSSGNTQQLRLQASQIVFEANGAELVYEVQGGAPGIRHFSRNMALNWGSGALTVTTYMADVYQPIYASAFVVGSDPEWKTDARPVEGALAAIENLTVYDYDMVGAPAATYTEPYEGIGPHPEPARNPARGVMAPDVEAVLPHAVTRDANGFQLVDVYSLLATTMAAVQELSAEVATLKASQQ